LQVEGYNLRLQPYSLILSNFDPMMYNADTELLFPPRIIKELRSLRGASWQKLLAQVVKSGEESPEVTGFVLFMVRINGCASCNADSFRAMHGCTQCAKQAIRRLKESDKTLVKNYESARLEVLEFQKQKS
jgi:hypothetical protein